MSRGEETLKHTSLYEPIIASSPFPRVCLSMIEQHEQMYLKRSKSVTLSTHLVCLFVGWVRVRVEGKVRGHGGRRVGLTVVVTELAPVWDFLLWLTRTPATHQTVV